MTTFVDSYRFAAGGLTLIAEDTFSRANSTTLGNTEVGSFAWSETSGNLEIVSNAVEGVFGSNVSNIAVFDAGVSDCTLTANVRTSSAADRTIIQLMCRYVDSNDWLAINVLDIAGNNTFAVAKSVAGAESTPTSYAAGFGPSETHEIVAVFDGSSIECWLDGVSRLTTTQTDHLTATKWGIRIFTGDAADNGAGAILDLKLEA